MKVQGLQRVCWVKYHRVWDCESSHNEVEMQLFHRLKDRSAVVQIKINISVILDFCEVEMEQSIPIIISLDVQTEEKLSI